MRELLITQQLQLSKVLLIGDSCIDKYHEGVCSRINPEAPTLILSKESERSVGGMSLNVSKNLKNAGVALVHITNKESIVKNRYIDTKFSQQLLRVDEGELSKVAPLNLDLLDDNYDVIIMSDYDKGFLSDEIMSTICNKYKDAKVFVDSKKENLFCLSNCFLKINKHEARLAKNIDESVDMVVTDGKLGALYRGRRFQTDEVKVFDVSGAGDVFLSAMVIGHIVNLSEDNVIRFACMAATKSVTKMGTYALTEEDWEKTYEEVCI